MDKQTLLDMGFYEFDKKNNAIKYHGAGFRILTASPYEKFRIDIPWEEHDLTINTKFDLEQLLKILGE